MQRAAALFVPVLLLAGTSLAETPPSVMRVLDASKQPVPLPERMGSSSLTQSLPGLIESRLPPIDRWYLPHKLTVGRVVASGGSTSSGVPAESVSAWGEAEYGLSSAIIAAYSYHRTLVLRPDDVWLAVAQGAAAHVTANEQAYRHLLVAHAEGKKMLNVTIEPGQWEQGVDKIVGLMREGAALPGVVEAFAGGFSTSDRATLTATSIVLIDALKSYFHYMMTSCGLPAVELHGTREDWASLLTKADALGRLLTEGEGLADNAAKPARLYFANLQPVLEKLLATYDGDVDSDWWAHIISIHEPHQSGERTGYSGWFRRLFFYGNDGKPLPLQEVDITSEKLTSGKSSVPFTHRDNGADTNMTLVAGHLGYNVRADGAVEPIIAWAVRTAPLPRDRDNDEL
eukprot:m51a1_g10495 hypothetical protein (400) ;mRNA; r:80178-81377